jgi:hypothetical protein
MNSATPVKSSTVSMNTPAYTDALERALGRIVGDMRREADAHAARSAAVIAELQAKLAEVETRCAALVDAADRRVSERLAEVRDGADVDMEAVNRRVDDALAAIPAPKDGKDADPAEIERMVQAAVAAIPPAPAGKDADPEEVERLVSEHVARAVAAIPPAEPGRDADPDEVRRMVDDAVAALPPAAPGRDADPDEIAQKVLAMMPGKDELRGAPGRLPIVKAWADGVHYEGNVVTFGGATYQAQRDTGRDPSHDDWLCIAAAGAEGKGYSYKGTYKVDGEYFARDVVMFKGSSWAAKQDNPGPIPGDGWHLWASRGSKGEGAKGDKGDPGASIVDVMADDQGLFTFRMADGRELQADLYPALSRIVK